MHVGTRELKNRLSHYLRQVREQREPIYVTDHGEIVAELRPVTKRRKGKRTDKGILLEMAARGDVTLGSGRLRGFRPLRVAGGKPLSRIVIEERR